MIVQTYAYGHCDELCRVGCPRSQKIASTLGCRPGPGAAICGAPIQLTRRSRRELSSGAALSDFLTPPLDATGPPTPIPNCRGRSPALRSAGRSCEPSFSVNNVVGGRSVSFGVVLCQTCGYPPQCARPDAPAATNRRAKKSKDCTSTRITFV